MRPHWFLFVVSAAVLAGCAKSSPPDAAGGKSGMFQAVPPHGGTSVPLGDDYSLELVRDEAAGTLSAYVFDDEMEDFMRSSNPSITIVAQAGGKTQSLVLSAVANSATGERVGDTSQFEASVDWSNIGARFDGALQTITIRGSTFTGVHFEFPK